MLANFHYFLTRFSSLEDILKHSNFRSGGSMFWLKNQFFFLSLWYGWLNFSANYLYHLRTPCAWHKIFQQNKTTFNCITPFLWWEVDISLSIHFEEFSTLRAMLLLDDVLSISADTPCSIFQGTFSGISLEWMTKSCNMGIVTYSLFFLGVCSKLNSNSQLLEIRHLNLFEVGILATNNL